MAIGKDTALRLMLVDDQVNEAEAIVSSLPNAGIAVRPLRPESIDELAQMLARSFGRVPTPAIVAPIEFTMRVADYRALGGHVERMRSLADVIAQGHARGEAWDVRNPWPAGGTV